MKVNISSMEAEARVYDIGFNTLEALTVNVVNEDGEILDSYQHKVELLGKDNLHSLQIRTKDFGDVLNIRGAYFAFLFGQNVFTVSKPQLLVKKVFAKVVSECDFKIPEATLKKFYSGDIQLNKIDLAVNYRFESEEKLIEAFTQIKRQLVEMGSTVTAYDKNVKWTPQKDREYSISFYAKGPKMRRIRKHDMMDWANALYSECSNILRVEIRVRYKGLWKMGLDVLSNWKDGDSERLYQHYFKKLPNIVITSLSLDYKDLSKLPSKLKPVLALHESGVDIARVFKKSTLQRHKRWFKQTGINLSKPNHKLEVKPLKDVISPKNAIKDTPEWMRKVGIFPKRPKQVKPADTKSKK